MLKIRRRRFGQRIRYQSAKTGNLARSHLHSDCQRTKETSDPDHGRLGAEFAAELRSQVFELPDHDFALLYRACVGHTHGRTHSDITIQTCWDADRLDLGRVGITPDPSRLVH